MNSTHAQTLTAVFGDPANGNIEWRLIEALLLAVGCRCIEGRGLLSPSSEMVCGCTCTGHIRKKKPCGTAVRDVRQFLMTIGVKP